MSRFLNERPHGGVGQYVDTLLDEKIVMLKKQLEEHLKDSEAHVTEEEKEKWNEIKESVDPSSSEPSGDDTSSTIDPAQILELARELGFVTKDDIDERIDQHFLTEAEFQSWVNELEENGRLLPAGGSGSSEGGEGGEGDDDDVVTDDVIIDKFRIDSTKVPLAGTKALFLSFENGRLSIKPFTAQTASISLSDTVKEYGWSGDITINVNYNENEMQEVVVKRDGDSSVLFKNKKSHVYSIDKLTSGIRFNLSYTPKEDTPGTGSAAISVQKRYYTWASSAINDKTLQGNGVLAGGNPGSMSVTASSGQYAYFAWPTSWGINVGNLKDAKTNLGFAYEPVGEVNSPYEGDGSKYTIIRSAQANLGSLTIKTN